MTDREHITLCETCGKLVYPGDQYQPGGDCDFCPEHAAALADCPDFRKRELADQSDLACWPDQFGSIEDAREFVESIRQQIALQGADRKPRSEAPS